MKDQVLKQRSVSAIIFSIVVLTLIFWSPNGHYVLLSLVALGIAYELNIMVKTGASTMWISLTLMAFFIGFMGTKVGLFSSGTLLGIGTGFHLLLAINVIRNIHLNLNKAMLMWPVIFPGIATLLYFDYIQTTVDYSYKPLLGLILLIWVSDSAAYLVGRKLGKRKLLERVSPNKTIEGFLGAGFFSFLAGAILYYLLDYKSLAFWLCAGLIVWLYGTMGDLYQSFVKRQYGVKDSGNFIPGHGGMWDRFDSFIFTIPFYLFLIKIFS